MRKSSDIYEHLAKIYLESSSNKKKKHFRAKPKFRSFLKFSAVVTAGFLLILIAIIFWHGKPSQSEEATVAIGSKITKISFPASGSVNEGIATFDLKGLDFLGYKTLGFSARKSNYLDKLVIRVELMDSLGRRSKVYVDQLPVYKWKDFEIKLREFKGTSDRSKISLLALVVEEWKTKEKDRAALYIDNIRLLK